MDNRPFTEVYCISENFQGSKISRFCGILKNKNLDESVWFIGESACTLKIHLRKVEQR